MPQIKVNEIDQSVVTRVVSDDKVKVLCPIISSFGPAFDGTNDSVKTFTDLSDFRRAFGYTYAEFDPFENDYSYIYARELIKRGAAVSVVRLNTLGQTADFDIGAADRSTPSTSTICKAAYHSADIPTVAASASGSDPLITGSANSIKLGGASNQKVNIIPGTVAIANVTAKTATGTAQTLGSIVDDGNGNILFTSETDNGTLATIDYVTGTITAVASATIAAVATTGNVTAGTYKAVGEDAYKYTFCPQIESITAKYPGSFGNNIMISIAQVNTTRLAESYQYAVISVYYIDQEVNYNEDGTVTRTVNNTTLLENKRISTNPNDANYFEDVEFEFIKINATDSARAELAIVWSNIEAAPQSNQKYSGFPVIPFRYKVDSFSTTYNFDALFGQKTYGTDFPYSDGVLTKLKTGFKDYWSGTGWSVSDINAYLNDVYASGGIVESIYNTLASVYTEFKDPYIFDFDFITSSGFVYEKYSVDPQVVAVKDESVTAGTAVAHIPVLSTRHVEIKTKYSDVATTMKADASGKFYNGSTLIGTLAFDTGIITLESGQTLGDSPKISYSYNDTTVPNVATVVYPLTSNADGYFAQYSEITPIHASMKELVETRQDCIALFDVPHDYDKSAVVEYSRMLNTSYGTIHNPWCWINSPDIAGKQILMAPSYIFLYTLLSNLIDNVEAQKWFPPAGVGRATARVVVRPEYEIGSVILNAWQNDNTSRVNPIMKLKQYGYVIYGQYTTLEAIDLYTHSALESLNVRLIANVVKKKIFDACLNLAFEPNTQTLWLKFFAQMDEYLRFMKYNQGLYDYKIVMDESTVTTDDINHLRCPGKVYIAPTRTAEFFDIDFIITGAGAIFTD